MQLLLLPVIQSSGSPLLGVVLHTEQEQIQQVGPEREGGPTHCASLTFYLHSSSSFDNSLYAENEK